MTRPPKPFSGSAWQEPAARHAHAAHDLAHEHAHPPFAGHAHAHDHPDPHPHEPGAEKTLAEPYVEAHERRALTRAKSPGRLLYLDAHSGLAGDMTIAALIDLGVPFELVRELPELLGLSGVALRLERVHRQSIKACRFCVDVMAPQPPRSFAAIQALLTRVALSPSVRETSQRVFERLARAEAEVHGVSLAHVHLHEVGAADALIDVVGTALCLDYLGARVVASPLPMGRGRIACAHGDLPAPAPATLLCLRGVPTYDGGLDTEFVTPTGAAIIASVAEEFTRWPSMVVDRVGWGAGSRALPDRPNALRAVLGTEPEPSAGSQVIVECNVDDMPGEVAGHALTQLLAAGALDVWAVPCVMKKGRPGLTLSALCHSGQQSFVVDAMLRETSSIGVRHFPVARVERPRTLQRVQTPFGPVMVKVSRGPFGPRLIKPEFEDCARLAAEHGVAVRLVLDAAQRAAEDQVEEQP